MRDVAVLQVWTASAWQVQGDPNLENLAGVGINSSFDPTNRLSVASTATLLNHDGAGHQIKINKSDATETGSLLYQTGFSGRAEMGLAGTDDFSIKVSADGGSWQTAIAVTAANGHVEIGQLLNLAPGSAPVVPAMGDIYFDSSAAMLRCYDGTVWQDLF